MSAKHNGKLIFFHLFFISLFRINRFKNYIFMRKKNVFVVKTSLFIRTESNPKTSHSVSIRITIDIFMEITLFIVSTYNRNDFDGIK